MHGITVLSLAGAFEDLTGRTVGHLKRGAKLVLRTAKLQCFDEVVALCGDYEALDALYEATEDFDLLNERIARRVLELAEAGEVLYGVLDPRDESVSLLMERAGCVTIVGGGFADGALLSMMRGPGQVLAAIDVAGFEPDAAIATLVREIDTQLLASDVKTRLMDRYPDQHLIFMKVDGGEIVTCPLTELDRQAAYSHRVSALIPAVKDLWVPRRYGFSDLLKIIAHLRGDDGCPWDKKQTHASLRESVLEEAHEVVDAIDQDDIYALYDELGDLLMLIVMQAQIGADHGEFSMDDVTSAISEKMLRRHPHIFSDATAEDERQVKRLWEEIKSRERGSNDPAEKMLSVPKALPALMRANDIQAKAQAVGFDFSSADEAMKKVFEEIEELRTAIRENTNIEEELGDLLFAIVNVSRLLKCSSEVALGMANEKFVTRFTQMNALIAQNGKNIYDMTLKEMDVFWDMVKQNTKNM